MDVPQVGGLQIPNQIHSKKCGPFDEWLYTVFSVWMESSHTPTLSSSRSIARNFCPPAKQKVGRAQWIVRLTHADAKRTYVCTHLPAILLAEHALGFVVGVRRDHPHHDSNHREGGLESLKAKCGTTFRPGSANQ